MQKRKQVETKKTLEQEKVALEASFQVISRDCGQRRCLSPVLVLQAALRQIEDEANVCSCTLWYHLRCYHLFFLWAG
jgi:hypothetical protein